MNEAHKINKQMNRLRRLRAMGPRLERLREQIQKTRELLVKRLAGFKTEREKLAADPSKANELKFVRVQITKVEEQLQACKARLSNTGMSKQQTARLQELEAMFA